MIDDEELVLDVDLPSPGQIQLDVGSFEATRPSGGVMFERYDVDTGWHRHGAMTFDTGQASVVLDLGEGNGASVYAGPAAFGYNMTGIHAEWELGPGVHRLALIVEGGSAMISGSIPDDASWREVRRTSEGFHLFSTAEGERWDERTQVSATLAGYVEASGSTETIHTMGSEVWAIPIGDLSELTLGTSDGWSCTTNEFMRVRGLPSTTLSMDGWALEWGPPAIIGPALVVWVWDRPEQLGPVYPLACPLLPS